MPGNFDLRCPQSLKVALEKSAPGPGFQIAFKLYRPLALAESRDRSDGPWTKFGGVRDFAGVVLIQTLPKVRGLAGVVLVVEIARLKRVDVMEHRSCTLP